MAINQRVTKHHVVGNGVAQSRAVPTMTRQTTEIAMRKWNTERGMSLVEATIILMVLSILTAVIAPSVGDYIEDARHTKAKEDVEAIGGGILRTVRDSGLPCLVIDTP